MRRCGRKNVRSGPFGVLDIGSTKIACLIGRAEADGRLRALGFGWQKGRGIKSGGIVDLDEAEKAIRAAVGAAEDMADTRLKSVLRQSLLRAAGNRGCSTCNGRSMAGR